MCPRPADARRPAATRPGRDPYRRIARRYDSLLGGMNAGLRGIGLAMHPPYEGMEVLDVGCGTGLQLTAYLKAGCRISGIDASAAMLEVARRRLGDVAALHVGDAARMPFADDAFDLVIAATMLHEMPAKTRDRVIAEMRRVLRPDGRMLLVDFEEGPLWPLRSLLAKAVISVAERIAGREHHRNSRDFIRRGALSAFVASHGLAVEQRKVASGGAIGVVLVSPARRPSTP